MKNMLKSGHVRAQHHRGIQHTKISNKRLTLYTSHFQMSYHFSLRCNLGKSYPRSPNEFIIMITEVGLTCATCYEHKTVHIARFVSFASYFCSIHCIHEENKGIMTHFLAHIYYTDDAVHLVFKLLMLKRNFKRSDILTSLAYFSITKFFLKVIIWNFKNIYTGYYQCISVYEHIGHG